MGSMNASLRGLGTAADTTFINQGVTVAGGATAAALSTAAGASALATIGITSAAIPFIGPAVAAVTLLVSALHIGQGCGASCTESTQVVNQAAPLLQQNLDAAKTAVAQQGCLTEDELQVLTNNFNTIWAQVKQQCGQIPAPGGTQCISDRQPGGKYDWASYYLTPIQQMPICPGTSSGAVAPTTGAATTAANPTGSSMSGLLIPAALIAIALFMGGKN
jgi:hypothetical protein